MTFIVPRNWTFASPRMRALLLLAAIFVFFPQQSFAWTDAIIAAFKAVAAGNPSREQEALARRSNFELQMMAEQKGALDKAGITAEEYQKIQNNYSKWTLDTMKDAAQDAGLDFKPQTSDPNKPAKPGTDIDGHLIGKTPDQQITADDVKNARQAFNDRVNQYLKANKQPPLENPAAQLKADMMPAGKITPQEFGAAASYINNDGGTMYRDPVPARVKAYLRGDPVQEPSLVDWARYVSEQQRQVMNHSNTEALTAEISKGSNAEPGSKEYIDVQNSKGEVQLEAEQTGKYQSRINQAATAAGTQSGVPAELPTNPDVKGESTPTEGRAASERVSNNRGPGMENDAGTVDALRGNTTLRNTESFVETVARIAQDKPELRGQANEAIAEATRNLSPSQRAAILERIANDSTLGGKGAASQIAEAMRNNSVPDTRQQLNSKLTQPASAETETPQSGDGANATETAPTEGEQTGTGAATKAVEGERAGIGAETTAVESPGVQTGTGTGTTTESTPATESAPAEGEQTGTSGGTKGVEGERAGIGAETTAVESPDVEAGTGTGTTTKSAPVTEPVPAEGEQTGTSGGTKGVEGERAGIGAETTAVESPETGTGTGTTTKSTAAQGTETTAAPGTAGAEPKWTWGRAGAGARTGAVTAATLTFTLCLGQSGMNKDFQADMAKVSACLGAAAGSVPEGAILGALTAMGPQGLAIATAYSAWQTGKVATEATTEFFRALQDIDRMVSNESGASAWDTAQANFERMDTQQFSRILTAMETKLAAFESLGAQASASCQAAGDGDNAQRARADQLRAEIASTGPALVSDIRGFAAAFPPNLMFTDLVSTWRARVGRVVDASAQDANCARLAQSTAANSDSRTSKRGKARR
jgi:hypothetical protein